jgi:hypothetical protein
MKMPTLEETNLAVLRTKQLLAQETLQRTLAASLQGNAAGGTPMLGGLPVGALPVISLPQIAVAPGVVNPNGLGGIISLPPPGERLDCRVYVG